MPQERENQFPFPTAEDVAESPGTREQKAARNVIVRYVTGIPRRGYLLGESDHAPIYRGVADLTAACYALVDAINTVDTGHVRHPMLDEIVQAKESLVEVLEHHGCPTAAEQLAERAAQAAE